MLLGTFLITIAVVIHTWAGRGHFHFTFHWCILGKFLEHIFKFCIGNFSFVSFGAKTTHRKEDRDCNESTKSISGTRGTYS